jgi:acetyl esterase/lipase
MRRRILAAIALGALAGCTPFGLINATVPDTGYRPVAAVSYGAHPRQRLDVYVPDVPDPSRSVVVFFYGGSWQGGRRENYRFVGEALASEGFVAVIPDYRVYPEVVYPAFLEDAAAAVRWVRDHIAEYGADASRLFLAGHSAGAYNAAMLAIDARWLAAHGLDPARDLRGWVGISGPYDFLPLQSQRLEVIFGPEDRRPDTQPVTHVSPGAPPALLMTGTDDSAVLPRNSERLAAKLREAGVPAQIVRYPGAGHARTVAAFALPFRGKPPVLSDLADFVRRH